MTSEENRKLINSLSNRINVLKRELDELKTANIDVVEEFQNFASKYFRQNNITVFTLREFRKKFAAYMKHVRNFTAEEVRDLLYEYCENNELIIFPRYENHRHNYTYAHSMEMKHEGFDKDGRVTFVLKKDTEMLSELIESLTKK